MFNRIPSRTTYFLFAITLIAIEITIALYARDNFIRPYVGDYLVVILLYCLLMTFFRLRPLFAVSWVFCFACVIEGMQYLHIVTLLGLEDYDLARVIMGTSFEWGDIVAYACGCLTILMLEKIWRSKLMLKKH